MKRLLKAGARANAWKQDKETALLKAATEGHEEVTIALAEGGADLEAADNDGWTSLMRAAYWGRSGVVRRLLELGADHTAVGTGGRYEGKTALECAVRYSNEEAAALLREWAGVQTFPQRG